MCGIAGIIHFDRTVIADRSQLQCMTDSMVHRGPDDEGHYLERNVGLGHRRLSIIDRAKGHQPISNEDDSAWIVYNGEIYNYQEIRNELIDKGHRFKTDSDTEVILHLYEDLGEQCLARLHGMFTFAIWDRNRDRLFLARDRLGIKPLYYRHDKDSFAFSSTIRPLLTLGDGARLNLDGMHEYLTFRYNIAPRTSFDGIAKLPPGYWLSVDGSRVTTRQYWDLDFSKKKPIGEAEAIERFDDLLRTTTASHLVGEVPLGVLLSGGLDSTVIAAIMSERAEGRVKTFSVGFETERPELDDRPYARLAAQALGTDHHEITLSGKDFVAGVPLCIEHMEEPMADAASIPLYYVSRLARDYVTVILSGEGADEMLAGYSFWLALKGYERARQFRRIPSVVRHGVLAPLNRSVFASSRLDRYLRLADLPVSHYATEVPTSMTDVFSEDAKQTLYSRATRERGRFSRADAPLVDAYRKTFDFPYLDQMLYAYSKQWMADDLLLKADKMTMAHSLELRVPFLDPPIVEFMASLPPDMKLRKNRNGFTTKYVLRKAMEGRIPREILHRSKVGFHVPLWDMFDTELGEMAHDTLQSRRIRESGLFDPSRVDALLQRHGDHRTQTVQVWTLLVFALWLDLFKVAV